MSRQTKYPLLLMPPARDFLVLPYYPGQSISGWFDGTASLLSSNRLSLFGRVLEVAPTPAEFADMDLDVPSASLLRALQRVESHQLGKGKATGIDCLSLRLISAKRHAYCPLCMASDAHQGRWPMFRNSWTWAYRTYCDIHFTPLYLWPLVKAGVVGEREYPGPWIDSFLNGNIVRRASRVMHFDMQLQSARHDLRMLNSDTGFALAWRQQLHFEQDLAHLFKGDSNIRGLIACMGPRQALIRAIKDLVFLVSNNFYRGTEYPFAAIWCSEAGAPGMFVSPPRVSSYQLVAGGYSICRIENPAIRRAILNVVFRLLAGFQSNMRHCRSGGVFSESGENRVTDGLRDLPSDAKDWCRARIAGWPQLLASGVIRSF